MCEKEWYNKYWKEKETPMFIEWFEKEYGSVIDFVPEPDEQQEYWIRRAFALMGWNGRGDKDEENRTKRVAF